MHKKLLIKKEDVIPSDERFSVLGVFNPGAIKYGSKTILLLRVAETLIQDGGEFYSAPVLEDGGIEAKPLRKSDYDFSDPRVVVSKSGGTNYLTSISHLRIAESDDGENFRIHAKPAVLPRGKYEEYGLEDSRIVFLEGKYYITHSCASRYGILTGLIVTEDFKRFERKGYIFHPDNKDVVIFPKKVGGRYAALHRPSCSHFGKLAMWAAYSPDLLHFGDHKHIYDPSGNGFDSYRVGAGCAPIELDGGFLEIYHGANENDEYSLGAMLLDKNDLRIIGKTSGPVVFPTEPYEKNGFFGGVVFSCGCTLENDVVNIYYGAADECVAVARIKLEDILDKLEAV